VLAALRGLAAEEGPFAVVALPCQVHAIRKLQMSDSRWRRRISLVAGLLCHYRLPHEATREPAALVAPCGERLAGVRYRDKDGRGWPFNTVQMTFSGGSGWRSPYGPAQTVTLLAQCYPRGRCATCVDAAAEFSDLSFGDPWIRDGNGAWKYCAPEGWTAIISRTQEGEAALRCAADAGRIVLTPIPAWEIECGQYAMMSEKKLRVPLRMRLFRLAGMATPEYGVPFRPPPFAAAIKEITFLVSRLVASFGPLRRLAVRLAFSRFGGVVMRRRAERSRRAAVARLKARMGANGSG
jgi:coenzyme F420 hydrogenase subunit beta